MTPFCSWSIHLLLFTTITHAATTTSNRRKPSQRLVSLHDLPSPSEDAADYYQIVPTRSTPEAAVMEWGNSAIISALDAVVASFGPQTSLGAYFEVETNPLLASPINGVGNKPLLEDDDSGVAYPGPLDNADETEGSMIVMTNQPSPNGKSLTPVQMAKVAAASHAAALVIVNLDESSPDDIYRVYPQSDAEEVYAKEIDFPVVMISLASGNLFTSATVTDDMDDPSLAPNNGMPDRVRLYAADDRPFFEEVHPEQPIVYLIHNLLQEEECQQLIEIAEASKSWQNVNENSARFLDHSVGMGKVEGGSLWRTLLVKSGMGSSASGAVEERMEQVTGYPKDQFSEWQITKFESGVSVDVMKDGHPVHPPVATITVFLNDLDNDDGIGGTSGGEMVFPHMGGSGSRKSVLVRPRQGLAVVHHTITFEGKLDPYAVYGDFPIQGEGVKYVARKFVYSQPVPTSYRVVLPLITFLGGRGAMPQWVEGVFAECVRRFGVEKGPVYFDKLMVMGPILWLSVLVSFIGKWVSRSTDAATKKEGQSFSSKDKKKKKQKKKQT